MDTIEDLDAQVLGPRPKLPEKAADPLALGRFVKLAVDIDMVRLHVEDELVLGPLLGEGRLVLNRAGSCPAFWRPPR